MSHHGSDGPPERTVGGAGRVTLILLVVVVIVGGVPLRAGATLVTDGSGNGNGRNNRNSITVNSPEYNHGIQHITNTNASGITNTQASFCKKKFRHCRISQRLNVFGP
ncbi:hypothetical protein GCM10027176_61410 [Actinoallomurus bryophytorum]|uniref:Uncharacterized protein n=1 Tax=Actinoallomurus bryophytorum TaxID=1490222 RepID=A0A543CPA7_9ACTN|nr:hypothetical protein [Actinoallomurus bryophytorum]TQL98935.1 hypothetical protein FB559_4586 [Actinoallomurus bryophytorum]